MYRVRWIILIFFLLFLVGCTLTSPVKLPPQSEYAISMMKTSTASNRSQSSMTLLVSMPIASPGFNTDDMIYMDVPFKLRSYANHRWIAPPAQMLMPVVAQTLRNKNYFKAVVTPPFSGVTSYRLDTQLMLLEQEFLQPISQVHLVMQATVINNNSNQVLASRQFTIFVKAPGNDAYSGVLAANNAASVIALQIASFVVRVVG